MFPAKEILCGIPPMGYKKDPDTHKLVNIPMHPVPDKAKITILFLFFTIFQWKNNENQKRYSELKTQKIASR